MVSLKEYVARALDPWLWAELDKPEGTRYYEGHKDLYDDLQYRIARKGSLLNAEKAIDAIEAWNQHKIVCQRCRSDNDPDATECRGCGEPLIMEVTA